MATKTLPRPSETPGADEDEAIDPRIRERRQRVQRDEDRSRLGKIMVVLALVAIVAGSVAALRSPLLDVDHIRVVGARHTTPEAIIAASEVRRRMSMGDVALGATSSRVASLPWVLSATVSRRWPGTVRIRVTERRPMAQIQRAGGGWLLVDRTGRVLSRAPTSQPALVVLTGVVADVPGAWLDRDWDGALSVSASLPIDLRRQVTSVRHDGDGIGLRLFDSMVVDLGSGDDIASKLEALRTLLAQPDRHCFASINLQVANAPALTRRPGCV